MNSVLILQQTLTVRRIYALEKLSERQNCNALYSDIVEKMGLGEPKHDNNNI
jgi:hypothetical protein